MLFRIVLRDPTGWWSCRSWSSIQDAIDYDAAVPTNNVTAPINKIVLSQDSVHLSNTYVLLHCSYVSDPNTPVAQQIEWFCQRKFRHQPSCVSMQVPHPRCSSITWTALAMMSPGDIGKFHGFPNVGQSWMTHRYWGSSWVRLSHTSLWNREL